MSNSTINLIGHVLVSDIVAALDPMLTVEALAALDKELEGKGDELVMFDDCEVALEEAISALDNAGKLPEPEALDYLLNEGDVRELAEAIRCGDRETAELLLDRVLEDAGASVEVMTWIESGRYSRKAREAMRKPVEQQDRAA